MTLARLNPNALKTALQNIDSEKIAQAHMYKKGVSLVFEIKDLPLSATLILKQEALSVGGDFATPKDCILAKKPFYDGVLIVNAKQLERLITKCYSQPFGLKALAQELKNHLKAPKPNAPQIMAILNLTPDSFYEKSRFNSKNAIEEIYQLLEKGITLIDIGAASSKPGSEIIDPKIEQKRLKEVLCEIKSQKLNEHAKFSIDTYHASTAKMALEHHFSVLNDVSGFNSVEMLEVARDYKPTCVLMHAKKTPKDMQENVFYHNLFDEMDIFFKDKLETLEKYALKDIILDIGFGFAKLKEHNLALIKHLSHFLKFKKPLLVGASRKNTIGLITGREVEKRLSGTLALHLMALQNGASILRVHDVDEHIDLIKVFHSLEETD
ncbi:dihydropteroate synthase [Helicobacter cetorum]|uniref:dihydropteroate synthase n=1 Tax=Helicobacter cetorum (strain ATCC BAA-540 / CCUG 52418 / MIT 99-5656) TaxID=1163745 RepID=I0EUB5_HELCM|nr:dihydropteroate synthase [Helicobacter cetorum]AFI06534.1 dihydropteroate synthase [Helicobacter cetorum MIT 99-5656]